MSLSIDPGNRGDSIQETDRDMNNIKIVNFANPTDNKDAENMMYFDKKKTEKYVCQNMQTEVASLRHS